MFRIDLASCVADHELCRMAVVLDISEHNFEAMGGAVLAFPGGIENRPGLYPVDVCA
jgi:hypothetical protein